MTDHRTPETPAALADALGAVREQIRQLKDQEAQLREALLDRRPNGAINGDRFAMFIRHGTRSSLNKAALPQTILKDPRYWTHTPTQTVVTRALEAPPRHWRHCG